VIRQEQAGMALANGGDIRLLHWIDRTDTSTMVQMELWDEDENNAKEGAILAKEGIDQAENGD
jgi:hypothetical protein